MNERQGFNLRLDRDGRPRAMADRAGSNARYTDWKRKPERSFEEYQKYGPGPERYEATEAAKKRIATKSQRREGRKDKEPRGRNSRQRNRPENKKKNRTDTGMLSAAGGSTLIKELKDREQRLRGDDY